MSQTGLSLVWRVGNLQGRWGKDKENPSIATVTPSYGGQATAHPPTISLREWISCFHQLFQTIWRHAIIYTFLRLVSLSGRSTFLSLPYHNWSPSHSQKLTIMEILSSFFFQCLKLKKKLDWDKWNGITKEGVFSPVLNVIQHGLSGTIYHQIISKEYQHLIWNISLTNKY